MAQHHRLTHLTTSTLTNHVTRQTLHIYLLRKDKIRPNVAYPRPPAQKVRAPDGRRLAR